MKHGLRRRIERLAGVARPRRRASPGPARVAWPPRPVAPAEIAPPPPPRAVQTATPPRALRRWGAPLAMAAVFLYLVVGVALAFEPRLKCHRNLRGMRADARVVESVATFWIFEHSGCPSLEDLHLPPSIRRYDVWGSPFRIDCSGDAPVVWTAGPDGQAGTEDDVHFRR